MKLFQKCKFRQGLCGRLREFPAKENVVTYDAGGVDIEGDPASQEERYDSLEKTRQNIEPMILYSVSFFVMDCQRCFYL